MKTAKTVNYTPAMIEQLKAAAPLNYEKAQKLAETLDRSVNSVIAKAKSEGIEYQPKVRESKNGAAVVKKAELVNAIAAAMDVDAESLDSLEKATKRALQSVLASLVKYRKAAESAIDTGEETD